MRFFNLLLCLLWVGGEGLLAQSYRGNLTGTVTDQSGSLVPSAKVRVVELNTNTERVTETSAHGDYTIPQLQVGTYRIEVEARGFKTFVRNDVVVAAGSAVRINAALEVGEVTETVAVTGEAPLLQTDNSKIATGVTPKFIEDLPLVVAGQVRSPFDLALVTPEAKNSGSEFTLGGGQESGWDLTVDGISSTPNQAAIIMRQISTLNSPSVDAITEFAVDTNGYKAEFGRAGGGVISFVSKSGTNELHGTAYEFLRNEALDANNFFNNATGRTKPLLRQNNFGVTVGGPVWFPKMYNGRNRTFFFASYEGFRNRTTSPVTFSTIPLPEMYQGDFSNWKDPNGNLIPIYDPSTTRPDGRGGFVRDPFPGNKIPVERFSSVSREVIKLATMRPNVADPLGILNPNPRNNFLRTQFSAFGSGSAPWDKFSAKIDHNLTNKDRLAFLYIWGRNDELAPDSNAIPGLPAPLNDYSYGDTHSMVYRLNWDRTISPRVFNQMRGGVNNQFQERTSINVRQGWGTKIGLKNVPLPDFLFPGLGIDDYTGWGRAFFGNNKNKTFAFADDFSWIRGSHSLKFGFIYQRDHYNGGGCHTCTGSFNFSRLSTSSPLDQSGRTGNGFASMLLGEVSSAGITTERYVSDQWQYWAGYAQDDWRATSRLTINYGLRYEYTPPVMEGHFPNGISNFDPTIPNPAAGGRLGASVFAGDGPGRLGRRNVYNAWRAGISPRFGLAYGFDSKTVLRMSASRSFGSVKNTGGSAHWQGFVGGYNYASTDQLITPAFNWDRGVPPWTPPPFIAPNLLNNDDIPYWQPYDSGRLPEYLNWNLNFQRQLPGNILAEAGYNAVMGHHLTANLVNINQVDPQLFNRLVSQMGAQSAISLMSQNINSSVARAAGIPVPYAGFNGSVGQALRPYPQYRNIFTSQDGGDRSGNSSYHALVLKLEKRYASGLTFLNSYVFSKMLTDADAAPAINAGVSGSMNHYNRNLEKSLSRHDQSHVLKFNYSYEFPFGPGRKYLKNGFMSHLVGGWRIAGIHSYFSGTPMTVLPGYSLPLFSTGPNRLAVSDYEGWRAPVKGDKFDPFADLWWDPTAFNRTVSDTVPSGFKGVILRDRFGDATVNNPKVRSPWVLDESISVARTFQFSETVRMDFRWEAFNLFNRVRWGGPDSTLSSNTFGLIRSQANFPRQMQFALKLIF